MSDFWDDSRLPGPEKAERHVVRLDSHRKMDETIEQWCDRVGLWEHDCDQCPAVFNIRLRADSWDEIADTMNGWRQHIQQHEEDQE